MDGAEDKVRSYNIDEAIDDSGGAGYLHVRIEFEFIGGGGSRSLV